MFNVCSTYVEFTLQFYLCTRIRQRIYILISKPAAVLNCLVCQLSSCNFLCNITYMRINVILKGNWLFCELRWTFEKYLHCRHLSSWCGVHLWPFWIHTYIWYDLTIVHRIASINIKPISLHLSQVDCIVFRFNILILIANRNDV